MSRLILSIRQGNLVVDRAIDPERLRRAADPEAFIGAEANAAYRSLRETQREERANQPTFDGYGHREEANG